MVVKVEPAAEGKQQPQERHRDRDQGPAVFIRIGLKFVRCQLRIFPELPDRLVDLLEVAVPCRTRHVLGDGRAGVGERLQRAFPAVDAAVDRAGIRAPVLQDLALGLQPRKFAARIGYCPVQIRVRKGGGSGKFGPFQRVEHREHEEDAEEKQRDRRHVARAATIDILARQLARAPGQHRQGVPDPAFEMEDPMQQVVEERAETAMDVCRLPAGMAVRPDKRRAAIQASRLMGMAVPVQGQTAVRCLSSQRALADFAETFRDPVHAVPPGAERTYRVVRALNRSDVSGLSRALFRIGARPAWFL